jgi:hypothetical protein
MTFVEVAKKLRSEVHDLDASNDFFAGYRAATVEIVTQLEKDPDFTLREGLEKLIEEWERIGGERYESFAQKIRKVLER